MINYRPSYIEKLRNPKWQRKRLEIFQRDNWTCIECSDTKKTLHVHHLQYINGHEPWEYNNDNFQTLCEDCHNSKHQTEQVLEINDGGLKQEKENVISESTLMISKEIWLDVETRISNGEQNDLIIQFLDSYENESVKSALFEYYTKEEIFYNAIITSARHNAFCRLHDSIDYSDPRYEIYRKKYIDEYIQENPFEDYILKSVNSVFKQLVIRALKETSDNLITKAQNLPEEEMFKVMNKTILLKQIIAELMKRHKLNGR